MLWPKKNSIKEFDNKKKFLRLENSPPPITFLMIRPLSIKRVVSVGGWCPKAFGVEGVRLAISCVVMEKFSNAQTSGEFVKVCINFSPVDVSGARPKVVRRLGQKPSSLARSWVSLSVRVMFERLTTDQVSRGALVLLVGRVKERAIEDSFSL